MARYLRVWRKAHRRKGYRKDIKPGPGVRMGYVRPTRVKGATFKIRDVGAPGRGPKIIPIKRKGALRRLGYYTTKSAASRRRALSMAVKRYGAGTVRRMLMAQVIYRKRRDSTAAIFRADHNWLVKMYKMPYPKAAVRKWKRMTPRARALAMPGGRI